MNHDFIEIVQKLIDEQGKEIFINYGRCRAFLPDYTHGEHKKESRLILQAIEAGTAKEIDTTEDLSSCIKSQIRVLKDEYFLADEIATDVVDVLALVLKRKEKIKEPEPEPELKPKQEEELETIKVPKVTQISNYERNAVISLKNQGWNVDKIATSLNIDKEEIEKIIDTYEIEQLINKNKITSTVKKTKPKKSKSYNNYTKTTYKTLNYKEKKSGAGVGIFIFLVVIVIIVVAVNASNQSSSYNTAVTTTWTSSTTQQQTQIYRGDRVKVRYGARDTIYPNTSLAQFVYTDVFYVGSINYGEAKIYKDRNYSLIVGHFRVADLIKQ